MAQMLGGWLWDILTSKQFYVDKYDESTKVFISVGRKSWPMGFKILFEMILVLEGISKN